MLQLHILSGKLAGQTIVSRQFPFRVGQAAGNELVLNDAGVQSQHFQIELTSDDGFALQTQSRSTVALSGQPCVQHAPLRNGDIIEAGAVKMQFCLSPTHQRSLVPREVSTWTALLLLCLAQAVLIFCLTR